MNVQSFQLFSHFVHTKFCRQGSESKDGKKIINPVVKQWYLSWFFGGLTHTNWPIHVQQIITRQLLNYTAQTLTTLNTKQMVSFPAAKNKKKSLRKNLVSSVSTTDWKNGARVKPFWQVAMKSIFAMPVIINRLPRKTKRGTLWKNVDQLTDS